MSWAFCRWWVPTDWMLKIMNHYCGKTKPFSNGNAQTFGSPCCFREAGKWMKWDRQLVGRRHPYTWNGALRWLAGCRDKEENIFTNRRRYPGPTNLNAFAWTWICLMLSVRDMIFMMGKWAAAATATADRQVEFQWGLSGLFGMPDGASLLSVSCWKREMLVCRNADSGVRGICIKCDVWIELLAPKRLCVLLELVKTQYLF